MYKKDNLDHRICDHEPTATNTSTYREWIHHAHREIFHFDISDERLNEMTDRELSDLIDELDWLYYK